VGPWLRAAETGWRQTWCHWVVITPHCACRWLARFYTPWRRSRLRQLASVVLTINLRRPATRWANTRAAEVGGGKMRRKAPRWVDLVVRKGSVLEQGATGRL